MTESRYPGTSLNALSIRLFTSFRPRIARHSNTPGPIVTPVVATRRI